jgi:hypothetical protein
VNSATEGENIPAFPVCETTNDAVSASNGKGSDQLLTVPMRALKACYIDRARNCIRVLKESSKEARSSRQLQSDLSTCADLKKQLQACRGPETCTMRKLLIISLTVVECLTTSNIATLVACCPALPPLLPPLRGRRSRSPPGLKRGPRFAFFWGSKVNVT